MYTSPLLGDSRNRSSCGGWRTTDWLVKRGDLDREAGAERAGLPHGGPRRGRFLTAAASPRARQISLWTLHVNTGVLPSQGPRRIPHALAAPHAGRPGSGALGKAEARAPSVRALLSPQASRTPTSTFQPAPLSTGKEPHVTKQRK